MVETSQTDESTDVDHRAEALGRYTELSTMTNLGDREAWVVALKERGLTHAEIADVLGIAKGTVDSHNHRALTKYQFAYHTARELEDMYETPGDTHTEEDLSDTDPDRIRENTADRLARDITEGLGIEKTKRYTDHGAEMVYFEDSVNFDKFEQFVLDWAKETPEMIVITPSYRDRGPDSTKGNRLVAAVEIE